MDNCLQDKILAFKEVLRLQYAEIALPFPMKPVTVEEMNEIEGLLGVVLPSDLKEIASILTGEDFSLHSQLPFHLKDIARSVTGKTLQLREDVKLPERYVVLAYFDEDLILMETKYEANLLTPIYWLYIADRQIIVGDNIKESYESFHSYTEYFMFCVDREVQLLAEAELEE